MNAVSWSIVRPSCHGLSCAGLGVKGGVAAAFSLIVNQVEVLVWKQFVSMFVDVASRLECGKAGEEIGRGIVALWVACDPHMRQS